jgi:hypothetical protein
MRLSRPKSALSKSQRKGLFEVAHYKRSYRSPASEADIGYEFGATPSSDRALVNAIEKGEHEAGKSLSELERKGLVRRVHGGFEPTQKGLRILGPGFAAESRKKYKRDYALAEE